eukprot:403349142
MKCSQYLNLGDRSKFLLKSASDPIIKNIEFQDCELYEHFNFIASRTAENQCIRFNNQFKKSFLGLYQSYIVIFEESKNEQIQTPLYYFDINMSYFRKCKPQQNTKKELNTTAIHLELLFEDVSYQFQFIYPNIDTYKQWYQQGGTLSDTITQTNQILEKDLQVIMAQLLLAIDYMHDKNIMHRDLKLANILLTSKAPGSYDLRIADFGLACELRNDGKTLERCGTPTYIAPEILQGLDYNTKVDIFSLGSIMFNLISGRYLFSNDGSFQILSKPFTLCASYYTHHNYPKIKQIYRSIDVISIYSQPIYLEKTQSLKTNERPLEITNHTKEQKDIIENYFQSKTKKQSLKFQLEQINRPLSVQNQVIEMKINDRHLSTKSVLQMSIVKDVYDANLNNQSLNNQKNSSEFRVNTQKNSSQKLPSFLLHKNSTFKINNKNKKVKKQETLFLMQNYLQDDINEEDLLQNDENSSTLNEQQNDNLNKQESISLDKEQQNDNLDQDIISDEVEDAVDNIYVYGSNQTTNQYPSELSNFAWSQELQKQAKSTIEFRLINGKRITQL